MISEINSKSSFQSTLINSNSDLTFAQEEVIKSVLSNFDSSSLSVEDAQEIVSAFQDINVKPSLQLSKLMSSQGFNAQEVGRLAGVNQNGKMLGLQAKVFSFHEDKEENTISNILEKLFEDDSSNESNSSSIYENMMNYTNRILSLNDTSKLNLMTFLEQYKEENTSLSKEDANRVVMSYLSQILNDSNNYNHTSYYA